MHFSKRIILVTILFLAFILLGFLYFLIFYSSSEKKVLNDVKKTQSLGSATFSEIAKHFKQLAQEKGAVHSFEVLKLASLPTNVDLHLLAHVVGDELYIQEGVSGIKKCTHDFRNACSHSVVIGSLLEYGEDALPSVRAACEEAPGGKGAPTMCFHGFGHGVLAYMEYELPDAVSFCKKVGTLKYKQRDYVECVGGTIMEMVSGVHDRDLWLEKSKIYLSEEDPLYPCNADFMPTEVRPICLSYLTPHLFEFEGGDLAKPTKADFARTFRYCDTLPEDNAEERRACFGGLGKEFVVLAQDRDIRSLEDSTDEKLEEVYSLCLLAEHEEGIGYCVGSALSSYFWGGENDPGVSLRFCGVIDDPVYQNICFDELISATSVYVDNIQDRKNICDSLPREQSEKCEQRLLLNMER